MLRFLSLSVLTAVALYAGVLYWPGVFFSGRFENRGFVIVSRSPIPAAAERFIERASVKLKNSQLHAEGQLSEVYAASSLGEYSFFAPFCGDSRACLHPFRDIVFMAPADFEKGQVASPLDPKNTVALEKLLAREAVMLQIRKKVRSLSYFMLADWKKDGYAEHVVSSEDTDRQPSEICQGEVKSDPALLSYLNRLVVEYMMIEDKLSLDDILSEDRDPEQVIKILKARHCK